jgi:hypothetical protein
MSISTTLSPAFRAELISRRTRRFLLDTAENELKALYELGKAISLANSSELVVTEIPEHISVQLEKLTVDTANACIAKKSEVDALRDENQRLGIFN